MTLPPLTARMLLIILALFASVGMMLAVTPARAQVADQTSLQTWAQGLAPHSQLYLPDGPGPHPVVIYMHGCKRLQSHADLWGHALSANGYAVLALDSFSPRNFGPFVQKYGVCTGLTLWGRERSADLMTALYMIQRGVGVDTSSLDTQRIGVIGFSHGAWTTMDLMTQWTNGTLPSRLSSNLLPANGPSAADIDALVLVYPWCGIASLTSSVKAWAHIPPSQFLRPYKDSVVGDNGCNGNIASLTAAAARLGQGPVSDIRIDATGHAFDEPEGAFVDFDPAATDIAVNSVVSFFRQSL